MRFLCFFSPPQRGRKGDNPAECTLFLWSAAIRAKAEALWAPQKAERTENKQMVPALSSVLFVGTL